MKKYFFLAIFGAFCFLIGTSLYEHLHKKSHKSQRLSCHKKTTSFEKLYLQKKVKSLQKALKSGHFSIKIKKQHSIYMPSQLFSFEEPNKVELYVKKLFHHIKDDKKTSLHILVYENDKLDPKKKTKKAKLYQGYLDFNFKLDNKIVYKIQLDFYAHDGSDIKEIISCAKKSVLSL